MADSTRPSWRRLAGHLGARFRDWARRKRGGLQLVVELAGLLCLAGAGFAVGTALGLFVLGLVLLFLGNVEVT